MMKKFKAELHEDNGGGLHWVRRIDGEIVEYRATNGCPQPGRAGDMLSEIAVIGFDHWDYPEDWETPEAAQQTIAHPETVLLLSVELHGWPGGQGTKAIGYGEDDHVLPSE